MFVALYNVKSNDDSRRRMELFDKLLRICEKEPYDLAAGRFGSQYGRTILFTVAEGTVVWSDAHSVLVHATTLTELENIVQTLGLTVKERDPEYTMTFS